MHSFAISLLKACTEKCDWIHLRRSLFPSLSFCLFVSRSVFFPSFPHFIFASCLHWYQSVSSVFVNLSLSLSLCIPLIYSLFLFFLSHFHLCLCSPLSVSVLHSHPQRKIDDKIKDTETEVWWRLKRAVHNIVRHSRRHSGIQKMHFPSSNPESLI